MTDQKTIAFTVADAAIETLLSVKGFVPLSVREYLEGNLTVSAKRLPRWFSVTQLQWRLANIAAAELKTHFVLDSEGITEGALFTGTWEKLTA